MRAVFDTNIIIDYLIGNELAKKEIERYKGKMISIVTWMEVLVGIKEQHVAEEVKSFLKTFDIIPLDDELGELAVEIRKQYKLKLPDAVILATAEKTHSLLVTRDSKDFPTSLPTVKIPYRI